MLFRRTKRDVALTKSGEILLKESYRLLEQADRIKRLAKRTEAGEIGEVNIGSISSACFEVLPTMLDIFREKHPNVGFTVHEFDTADALPALINGTLDLGLVRLNTVKSPLEIIPLKEDYLVLAMPTGHYLSEQSKIKINDIKNETFTMFSREVSPAFFDYIMGALNHAGFSPELIYKTNSIQTQIAFVASGLGVALVPSTTKRQHIPGIEYRELDTPIPLIDISLVWNPQIASKLIRSILETMDNYFSKVN
jgi:DNA-binding transcriptional LysR family regulator